MGMILNLIRVSEETLEGFLANSELLEEMVYDAENFDAEWYCDVEKAWDGVQYLISGKSAMHLNTPLSPVDRALFSQTFIDVEQDLGYGPGQYLSSKEVKETYAALSSCSIEDYGKRYNGADMDAQGIYPGGWSDEESKEYVIDSLKDLIEFYAQASKNNEAVVTFMN